jgi:ATP-dependent exoDNAse (exonuclease V) beta subunit
MDWLKNPQLQLKAETRAKLYVGLTRARHSVAVVYDPSGGEIVAGFTIFE